MSVQRAFLDSGGSAPLLSRAKQALELGFADNWADPLRLSRESRQARDLLEGSREAIAEVLGCLREDVTFVPNHIIGFERVIGSMRRTRRQHSTIVGSAIERDAVLYAADFASPGNVTLVPVDREGHIDADEWQRQCQLNPALALLQAANQELGTTQDVSLLSGIARQSGVPVFLDASSMVGHLEVPQEWDALVAHPADWGGPAGIGVVAIRPQTRWLPVWPESSGLDAGGVNPVLALSAAVALQQRMEERADTAQRLARQIDYIRHRLSTLEGIDVLGDPLRRLPHVLTFSCLYADGEVLVHRLDRAGFAVGSGSACTSGTLAPSRVLAAVGALTHGNVRLSLHPGITDADIEAFLEALVVAIDEARVASGYAAP